LAPHSFSAYEELRAGRMARGHVCVEGVGALLLVTVSMWPLADLVFTSLPQSNVTTGNGLKTNGAYSCAIETKGTRLS
jgi:hypothetical protein